jgi:O-antigen/teichoic acid export membrane protein
VHGDVETGPPHTVTSPAASGPDPGRHDRPKEVTDAMALQVPTKERRRLFTTFAYLVAKQGATAVLGLGYWLIATRLFAARDVGLVAAASSVASFLGAVGMLGIPVLLLAETDALEERARRVIFTTGLAIACAVVLALSLGALVLSPVLGASLRVIGHNPVTAALFVLGSVATVASITFDNTAIGLHRGAAQLTRGALGGVLKPACVGVLILVGTRNASGLFLAWAGALALSTIACLPMLHFGRTPPGGGTLRRRAALTRQYGVLSLNHHVLNLSINIISYIVPLTAALLIAPRQVAYFTTAFLLSATVLIIPYLLALALFAEKADDAALLHRHVRRTLPFGLVLCGAIVVGVEVVAPVVLRLFGAAYAANGSTALRLLILVGPAYVIKDHYVAIRRAQRRLSDAAKVMALGTTAEAAGAVIGAVTGGMTGLCIGWAVAASAEALALSPAIMSVFRRQARHEAPRSPDP